MSNDTLITRKCKCRFSAALSSRCQISRERHRSSGSLIISALMIGAQQCHTQVPPTCAQQCTHLCPPVPPSSATHLCPPVPPTSAHQ
ncbi:unnamed protein product, partial [Staurois parvus]